MKKRYVFIAAAILLACQIQVFEPVIAKDMATKEAQYIKRVRKDQIKQEYKRNKLEYKPSGFMSMEEYEKKSAPKDKFDMDFGLPKVEKPYDMQYVPRPIYKLVKYNDPPGSPDLEVSRELFRTRQLNLPGITAPNLHFMVYPAVYYYPEKGAVACDLFIIPLRDNESAVNRILKANIANRFSEPILSTDKELSNRSTYRTLTPVDFSADSTKLLVKEKIGSSADGIWQTNLIVYDFVNQTSYNLTEIREAISYYWKEYKGLDLNDKRWDVFPLGFSKGNPDRIMLTSYAYTGEEPVFLGVWSIDARGEQARLISMQNGSIEVASNGFKIEKEGTLNKKLTKKEEKFEQKVEKKKEKIEEKQEKAEIKELNKEKIKKLKEVNKQYRNEYQDYRLMDRLKGSTEMNENIEKYEELQDKLDEKRRVKEEKAEEKQKLKEQKAQQKEQQQQIKAQEKAQQKENTPPKNGQPIQP